MRHTGSWTGASVCRMLKLASPTSGSVSHSAWPGPAPAYTSDHAIEAISQPMSARPMNSRTRPVRSGSALSTINAPASPNSHKTGSYRIEA